MERSNELYHYGVPGMKWGVRRYQPYTNKSGKVVLTKKDVSDSVKGLKSIQSKNKAKIRKIDSKYTEQGIADKKARKKQFNKKVKALKIRAQNMSGIKTSKAVSNYRKKDINRMSNKELKTAIERMQLERTYRSLTRVDITFGKRTVEDILSYTAIKNFPIKKK